ncbi:MULTISPECIES: amidohydrolase [Curtobacterium]|uniref:amidohydrolase n=1 Tax=Curtobacterium TaxID=2034 RepID=UPI0004858CB0|nr:MULTISPECIES: amidohydrolase [Curtobacterium]MBT1631110.1 amidohydrolase [Curtobacterium flaccumfaciens pv. oortii]MCS5510405.1 amidohydrolase [Curtobacterium flaccumfaciens pv. flaccumfaciens]MCX2786823.1 amidohydrolase [Curtobacterium flaccumfaciens pv. flaccumfaciens]MCX2845158.1 amidohydrolase [Curtobacterium flaccumfaciens pv. oortii]QKS87028.1 amidohydrolase [Curtobacterium flaccumfaciens pv. flaccumfaciens]
MSNSFAITGAHVVPVSAPAFDGGAVVVEDGRITAIGPDVSPPEGMTVIDAAGSWLVPGFVEAHGHVGIHEEANGEAGNDTNEMTAPNMAGVRAIDAIDIDDEGFRDALAGGITSIVVKPGSGNPIGGQSVAIKTWGGRTIDEQLISDSVSVKSALGENPKRVYGGKGQTPSTRLGVAKIIRDAFVEAQNYRAARDAAAAKDEPFARDLTKETLVRVLDGELVWDQHTHRHDDIATAIRLSEEFGYRLVVNHGTEAHKIADVLAAKDIPVIYGPLFTSRSKVELRDRGIPNLATIAAAGVRVAITTDAPVVPINMLVDQATAAVKEGLPAQTALEALTTNPAEFLGFGDRVGRLAEGYDADLVLWDGDPLDATSRATRVWIDGKSVFTWADGAGVTTPRW